MKLSFDLRILLISLFVTEKDVNLKKKMAELFLDKNRKVPFFELLNQQDKIWHQWKGVMYLYTFCEYFSRNAWNGISITSFLNDSEKSEYQKTCETLRMYLNGDDQNYDCYKCTIKDPETIEVTREAVHRLCRGEWSWIYDAIQKLTHDPQGGLKQYLTLQQEDEEAEESCCWLPSDKQYHSEEFDNPEGKASITKAIREIKATPDSLITITFAHLPGKKFLISSKDVIMAHAGIKEDGSTDYVNGLLDELSTYTPTEKEPSFMSRYLDEYGLKYTCIIHQYLTDLYYEQRAFYDCLSEDDKQSFAAPLIEIRKILDQNPHARLKYQKLEDDTFDTFVIEIVNTRQKLVQYMEGCVNTETVLNCELRNSLLTFIRLTLISNFGDSRTYHVSQYPKDLSASMKDLLKSQYPGLSSEVITGFFNLPKEVRWTMVR